MALVGEVSRSIWSRATPTSHPTTSVVDGSTVPKVSGRRLPLTTADRAAISYPSADAAGTHRTRAPEAPPSLDREGRARAVDRPPLVLPERDRRPADGAAQPPRTDAARARPPRP